MRGRLSCGSHCELIPFLEAVPAAEKPQAPPPLLNLYKKSPFPSPYQSTYFIPFPSKKTPAAAFANAPLPSKKTPAKGASSPSKKTPAKAALCSFRCFFASLLLWSSSNLTLTSKQALRPLAQALSKP